MRTGNSIAGVASSLVFGDTPDHFMPQEIEPPDMEIKIRHLTECPTCKRRREQWPVKLAWIAVCLSILSLLS